MKEAQVVILEDSLAPPDTSNVPGFFLPSTFRLGAADKNLVPDSTPLRRQNAQLGEKSEFPKDFVDALEALRGKKMSGPGFNQIFRPLSKSPELTKDKPIGMPANANNLLELNLTHEIWNFGVPDIGQVPNRGFGQQKDVFLNGLVYSQSVLDITNSTQGGPLNVNAAGALVDNDGNPVTVKDGQGPKPRDIHFETGMFLNVPATRGNSEPTLSRMASIPHGTTINLQGDKAFKSPDRKPFIDKVSITPFVIGTSNERRQRSQTANNQKEARLPQNLELHAKFITQSLLDDPNSMMNDHNKNKTFKETIVFLLSNKFLPNQSNPLVQALDALRKTMSSVRAMNNKADISEIELQRVVTELSLATNIGNISFLDGPPNETNASVAQVSCIFWVSTIEYVFNIPDWSPFDDKGNPKKDKDGNRIPLRLRPQFTPDGKPYAKGTVPIFAFYPNKPIRAQEVKVEAPQMQYTQTVLLNFGGESWPHVSVATVVPMGDVVVPQNKFKV